jgi:hypothetical protein
VGIISPTDVAISDCALLAGSVRRYISTFRGTDTSRNRRRSKPIVKVVKSAFTLVPHLSEATPKANTRFLADRFVEGICPYCGADVLLLSYGFAGC